MAHPSKKDPPKTATNCPMAEKNGPGAKPVAVYDSTDLKREIKEHRQ